jgi:anti-anti-sigma factor
MNGLTDTLAFPRSGCVVIELLGEHDMSTAREIQGLLTSQLASKQLVVVDLSHAAFVDSTVLNNLVWARRVAAEQGCRFRLQVEASSVAGQALTITGLLGHFEIARTREDAVDRAAATVTRR